MLEGEHKTRLAQESAPQNAEILKAFDFICPNDRPCQDIFADFQSNNSLLPQQGALRITYQTYRTPLGMMVGCFSPQGLCLLKFADCKALNAKLLALKRKLKASFVAQETKISVALGDELAAYFSGTCTSFDTPLPPRVALSTGRVADIANAALCHNLYLWPTGTPITQEQSNPRCC